jgi:hypothetical protein
MIVQTKHGRIRRVLSVPANPQRSWFGESLLCFAKRLRVKVTGDCSFSGWRWQRQRCGIHLGNAREFVTFLARAVLRDFAVELR